MMDFLVFLSGLKRIIKHFGPNSANKMPKLDAKMANTSTTSAYFPGELIYAGMKAIHTEQKISMLKVINLASLKLSGRFLDRNAKRRLSRASKPI